MQTTIRMTSVINRRVQFEEHGLEKKGGYAEEESVGPRGQDYKAQH